MYAGRKPNTYKIRSEIRSQIRLTVVRRYVLSLKKSRCADRGFADSAGYAVLTPSRALAHLRMQRVRNAHPARALSLERCPHTKTFTPTNEWSKIAAKALTPLPSATSLRGGAPARVPADRREWAERSSPARNRDVRERTRAPAPFPVARSRLGWGAWRPDTDSCCRAVALSRARFGYILTCGVCSPCGKGIYRVAHSTVS